MNNTNSRKTGKYYERLAGTFLEKQGYQILQYNYRCSRAEIDIIAKHKDTLVFCEVKSRTAKGTKAAPDVFDTATLQKAVKTLEIVDTFETVSALEAVNARKQLQISRAALHYLTVNRCSNVNCRFDVIGITGNKITWIKNAFDYITGV